VAGIGNGLAPRFGQRAGERVERRAEVRGRAIAAEQQRRHVAARELGIARPVRDERGRVGANVGPACLRALAKRMRDALVRRIAEHGAEKEFAGRGATVVRHAALEFGVERLAAGGRGRLVARRHRRLDQHHRRDKRGLCARELERDHRAEARADDDGRLRRIAQRREIAGMRRDRAGLEVPVDCDDVVAIAQLGQLDRPRRAVGCTTVHEDEPDHRGSLGYDTW
jgi:hypothetical protein